MKQKLSTVDEINFQTYRDSAGNIVLTETRQV